MLTLQESEPHLAFGIHSKNICGMNEWIKIGTTRPKESQSAEAHCSITVWHNT